MKWILEKTVDFSKLDNFKPSDLTVEMTKASLNKDSMILTVEMELNLILSADTIEKIKSDIARNVDGIKAVDLRLKYKDVKASEVKPKKQPQEAEAGSAGGKGKGGSGWNKGRKYIPVKGNVVMGKPVTDDFMKLGDITTESGTVAFHGEVFGLDCKTTKNDNKYVSIYVTDKATSICVKAFVAEKKWDDIQDHFPVGSGIRVKGKAQWDTFENALTVTASSLEKEELPKRMDKSPQKRVELHCHTKMSAMDGLNDTQKLVETVEEWGHPALAITDHGVVQAFPDAHKYRKNLKILYGCEGYLLDDEGLIAEDGTIDYKARDTYHIIILVKNKEGLKNLYKLVSFSHIDYFYKRPRIPRSVLQQYREGLILGSACEAGELYRALRNGVSEEKLEEIAGFYDYLEIQPLINNRFMVREGLVYSVEDLKDYNRRIVALGERCGKPVCATCDAHYFEPEDVIYRDVILAGMSFKDIGSRRGLYFRTTEEMLEEFAYLGEETARKVVIENTNLIADMIEDISPVADGKFPPKIEGAEEQLRTACEERIKNMYGDPLPAPIRERLDKELNSIIGEGYAVMYRAAEMLVERSHQAGYLVGSRGSVGSSFAATASGITEVNPLPAHYICPNCKNIEWDETGEYDCGVDMPDKVCPICGTPYSKEGFTIPFETFLGFDGTKEPDIDLNFAGEYQAKAQKYVEEIFGAENVFKAGTIGTIKDNTAYGFVAKYFDEKGLEANKFEVERLLKGCVGVKRTTGQHPGGVIIVPKGHEIYEFCPIQRPANDVKSDIITTHYEYHSIDKNLLKLDILGHDIPSMIRHLKDMTGVDPLSVPIKDEKVMTIFNGTEGLEIQDPDYKQTHGSYGIHEFGTPFVRQMLDDIKPSTIEELVRISGLSHGTDVWLGNAQDLVVSGVTTMREAIATRDDIMNYMLKHGLPNGDAFKIMERVRKGNGLTEEQEAMMREHGVADWYIESCKKIKYMFPRAHAVAYVIMSMREAYYKVYYPLEFYAAYFTTKAANFDTKVILAGQKAVERRLEDIENKGTDATPKEEADVTVLEVAYEMYARGYAFAPARLGSSDAMKFKVSDGKVLLPFCAIEGMGEGAAKAFAQGYEERPYETVEDICDRGKINKTVLEELRAHGVLKGLPETAQISFF